MSSRHGITPAERKLFRDTLGPIKRLDHDGVVHPRRRPPPFPSQTRRSEQRVLLDMLSLEYDPADLETGEEMVFARPGVPRRVLRKLRRGQYSVEAQLDLHGLTAAESREELSVFLRQSARFGSACVRIVHGKGLGSPGGRPILKVKLNHWLRQRDEVLAFCSARPADGGTGAIYVLLRR